MINNKYANNDKIHAIRNQNESQIVVPLRNNVLFMTTSEHVFERYRAMLHEVIASDIAVDRVTDANAVTELIAKNSHALCLIDCDAEQESVIQVLQSAAAIGIHAPIIMLHDEASYKVALAAMEAGASDALDKQTAVAADLKLAIQHSTARQRFANAERNARDRLANETASQSDETLPKPHNESSTGQSEGFGAIKPPNMPERCKETVLIVDDDPAIINGFSILIDSMGFNVLCAVDRQECLTQFSAHEIDLLIINTAIAGDDGLRIYEDILDLEYAERTNTPAILLTDSLDEKSVARSTSVGAHYVQNGRDARRSVQRLITDIFDRERPQDGATPSKVKAASSA